MNPMDLRRGINLAVDKVPRARQTRSPDPTQHRPTPDYRRGDSYPSKTRTAGPARFGPRLSVCVVSSPRSEARIKTVVSTLTLTLTRTLQVLADLKARTKMISTKDEIKNVATISANSDTVVGELIADAMERVGKEGVITVHSMT